MSNLRFAVPSEFTDDDIWFKFFRKKNLAVLVAGLSMTGILVKFTTLFGFPAVGLIIGGIITLITTGATMIPSPGDFLKGGAITLDIIIVRRHIRKKNATIYVRGYGKDNIYT